MSELATIGRAAEALRALQSELDAASHPAAKQAREDLRFVEGKMWEWATAHGMEL